MNKIKNKMNKKTIARQIFRNKKTMKIINNKLE